MAHDPLTAKELEEAKIPRAVARYQTWLSAWIDTTAQLEKQILTLSAAAIGLLLTQADDFLDGMTGWIKFLYIGSMFVFLLCVVSALCMFSLNAIYIQDYCLINEIKKTSQRAFEKVLGFAEYALSVMFAVAVAMATIAVLLKYI